MCLDVLFCYFVFVKLEIRPRLDASLVCFCIFLPVSCDMAFLVSVLIFQYTLTCRLLAGLLGHEHVRCENRRSPLSRHLVFCAIAIAVASLVSLCNRPVGILCGTWSCLEVHGWRPLGMRALHCQPRPRLALHPLDICLRTSGLSVNPPSVQEAGVSVCFGSA